MAKNYIKSERKPKERHQPPPKVTTDQMLIIADGIAEETGHYPSFGEVQTGIELGKINPKEYLEIENHGGGRNNG